MKKILVAVVICLALAATAQAREYWEKFNPQSTGVLKPALAVGNDGQWHGELGQGWYRMSNFAQKGAVRFFHVSGISGETPQTLSNSLVTVWVGGKFDDPISGAGLIYRFDRKTHTYWAFVVHGQGYYAVYRRNAKGLRQVVSGRHQAINTAGPNMLTIRPGQGEEVVCAVNGQPVATVTSPEITGHALGILVVSPGSFRFEKFRIETKTPK